MALAAPRAGVVRRLGAPGRVRPEALDVSPDLVGVPLAPHARRVGAMLVDLAVVALLSSTGSFWLVAAIAGLLWQWRRRRRERGAWGGAWLWVVIALLALVALQRGARFVEGRLDPDAAAAIHAGDAANETDADAQAAPALLVPSAADGAPPAASRPAPAEAALAAATARELQLARRVKQLEDELARARQPRPARWRDDVVRAAHRVGLGFGWAIAYFTLLPFWWQGQTVGKKLFGLRVMGLTGAPLTVIGCFGRYGGYAAGMATGASGFLQVLWDSNRQAIQDKIAHTVVVDLREARVLAPRDAAADREDGA